jgi:hypothetical protein
VKCWISGGFFAIHRKSLGDETLMLERATFEQFAKDHELVAVKHEAL